MAQIKLITSGVIKEKKYLGLIEEYTRRIHGYHFLVIHEIKESHLTEKDPQKAHQKQFLSIQKKLHPRDYLVSMDIKGKPFNSIQFASWLDQKLGLGQPLCFLIGGSLGLPSNINPRESISFSPMTFPHKLFRIMFLEQLYRTLTILNGEKYHK